MSQRYTIYNPDPSSTKLDYACDTTVCNPEGQPLHYFQYPVDDSDDVDPVCTLMLVDENRNSMGQLTVPPACVRVVDGVLQLPDVMWQVERTAQATAIVVFYKGNVVAIPLLSSCIVSEQDSVSFKDVNISLLYT